MDGASAEAESEAGGFEGVAARSDVVHKVGLAERQHLAIAGKVVLFGCDGAERQLAAGALGLHGLRAIDGFDNLSAGAMVGDVMGKAGVGVGVAGAVGDGDKPARAGDERGHFAGGGVEVNRGAGRGFDPVAADAGFGAFVKTNAEIAPNRIFMYEQNPGGGRNVPIPALQRSASIWTHRPIAMLHFVCHYFAP